MSKVMIKHRQKTRKQSFKLLSVAIRFVCHMQTLNFSCNMVKTILVYCVLCSYILLTLVDHIVSIDESSPVSSEVRRAPASNMFFLFLPKSSWSTTTGLIKNEDHLYTPNLIIFLFWTYLFIFRHIREMKRLHSFHLISFTSLSLTFLCLLKFRQVLPHYKQRTIQITFQVFQATSDKLTITKYPSLKLGKYHVSSFIINNVWIISC